ncbi:phage head closure protein [Sphingomonas hankookensis]|uniref:Head-tail adaptor protein n=1 Tax=Sphingomonas hankookensis TaxID=563996 RepID=A0ABR5YDP2_9SPHN|nr:phage head closure protein [Sphingomonas hankookensis]KZE16220.1 hypothetical protein AVT10_12020 [Sphingomonas hankookensis]
MNPAELDKRIVIERRTVTTDGYGGEVETWAKLCSPFAKVLYGTGAERRVAAQESSAQSATFRIRANSVTNTVTPADRIQFDGSTWDIGGNVPYRREGRDITATTSA